MWFVPPTVYPSIPTVYPSIHLKLCCLTMAKCTQTMVAAVLISTYLPTYLTNSKIQNMSFLCSDWLPFQVFELQQSSGKQLPFSTLGNRECSKALLLFVQITVCPISKPNTISTQMSPLPHNLCPSLVDNLFCSFPRLIFLLSHPPIKLNRRIKYWILLAGEVQTGYQFCWLSVRWIAVLSVAITFLLILCKNCWTSFGLCGFS